MDGGDSVTGIEILSSAQVVAETTFNCTAFWIIFGIFFGIIEKVFSCFLFFGKGGKNPPVWRTEGERPESCISAMGSRVPA